MKRVILIGHMNGIVQNVYDLLNEYYQVQICEPVRNSVMNMAKIVKPDALVIVKTSDFVNSLFREIRSDSPIVPIVTVCGSDDEWIRTYSGENNRFVVKPVKKEDLLNAIGGSTYDTSADTTDSGKTKILAIDDDPMVLRNIKGILSDEYDVLLAKSVEKGIDLIEKNKFSLILLDYEMPEVDGYTAMQVFKTNNLTKNIPVVFLTGVSDKKRITEVIELKPAAYLLKPINAELVKETIKKII